MPESVRDRCTKAHEYLFLLAKRERYYFDADAISEAVTLSTLERMSQQGLEQQQRSDRVPGKTNGTMKAVLRKDQIPHNGRAIQAGLAASVSHSDIIKRSGNKERKPASARGVPVDTGGSTNGAVAGSVPWEGTTRNKRSVWTVTTQPFKEAHFATFPPALIEPCVLAGCPERACSHCGAPWLRDVEREFVPQQDVALDKGVRGAFDQKPMDASNTWEGMPRGTTVRKTLGWSPACACGAPAAQGVTLDPFGGAGTTGLVADRLGRDAILIELNGEYCAMARKRILGDAPLFAEVVA
jgi:hypothetical protein